MLKKTEMGFSFSSDTDQWFTPPNIIRFAELLMGKVTHDLCGLSPYWSAGSPVKQHGEASDGILTFARSRELMGADVFDNPPYGWLPSQKLMVPYGATALDIKHLPKALNYDKETGLFSAPVPKSKQGDESLEQDEHGFYFGNNKKGEREQIYSRVHSAHTFAHYLLELWEAGVIRSAFLVIPSATDTAGHDRIFRSVGYVMNTVSRLSFQTPTATPGELKKVSGNTKGTSLFWLPPHSYNMDTETKWVSRLTTIRSMMGSDFPNINLSKYLEF